MKQILHRKTNSFFTLLVTSVFFLSCIFSSCSVQNPILVGFSAGLTGQNAALGVDGRDGVILAIETINANGGINGRPLELLVRDDKATPEGAIRADMELVEAGVVAIIGHMTSESMMDAWAQMKDKGVVYISPTVSTPQLQGLKDNFFRLIPVNSFQAKNMARYAAENLGLQRIAIFFDKDNIAFSETYRDGFVEQTQRSNIEIVAEYLFSSSAKPDFKPMLLEVQAKHPDGILTVASAVDTALIAQQANLIGLHVQFLSSNWALTEDLIQNGGETVEGILTVVTHDENNQSVEYLDFSNRFQERFSREPTFAAGYGYDSVLVLAAALEKTDGEADGLAEAIPTIQAFPGIHGRIALDKYGDVNRSIYLITVKEGRFQTLEVLDIDTKE